MPSEVSGNFVLSCPVLVYTVLVLGNPSIHQDPRDFPREIWRAEGVDFPIPSFGGARTFFHRKFVYRLWIRKSFSQGRDGLTVLKSILPKRVVIFQVAGKLHWPALVLSEDAKTKYFAVPSLSVDRRVRLGTALSSAPNNLLPLIWPTMHHHIKAYLHTHHAYSYWALVWAMCFFMMIDHVISHHPPFSIYRCVYICTMYIVQIYVYTPIPNTQYICIYIHIYIHMYICIYPNTQYPIPKKDIKRSRFC